MRVLVDGLCCDWAVSIRRACGGLQMERSSCHYKCRRSDPAALRTRIREICETRIRYGYRRVHVQLRGAGWEVNHKRGHRTSNEMGLQLRNKPPKRPVNAKLREDRRKATQTNETWAMDFVHDQLASGRKLRVLTVVYTWSPFSPVIDPRFSCRAEYVVATLDRICSEVGFPKPIGVDQGSEFVSRDLDLWAYR